MTIALFTLGGTIAMAGVSGDARSGPVVTRLSGVQLTAAVPGLADLGVALDVQDTRAVPSPNLTFAQLLDLVEAASRSVAEGATGIVATQGTDTLEESAFLVDLVWRHEAPFVLTGAMRNPTLAGADGPANLLAAVRVAASAAARGLGALVVANDEIHAPRWVRKTHSTSTATFASPNAGPIGHVIEGRVRVLAAPPRREPLPLPSVASVPAAGRPGSAAGSASGSASVPVAARPGSASVRVSTAATSPTGAAGLDATRVALHTVTLDDDGALLDGLEQTHQGLVVAGFGVGHVPSALAPVLGALAERIPVVLTSRTGAGSVLRHTYGAVGSETDLQRRGLINGGLLDPYKARVLLRLLLANGAGHADVTAAFAEHG